MQEQNYSNHTRFDPLFHYVGMPLALINLIGGVVYLLHRFSWLAVLLVVSSLALIVTLGKLRRYATQLQDRVVRIEENFRHYTLTGAPLDRRLTIDQIVALRFAGDEEFPSLCEQAVRENLKKDDIKRTIHAWRADRLRV